MNRALTGPQVEVFDRWIFPGTCLHRTLVSGNFLRKHKPVLPPGLIENGESAHAWVEACGTTFDFGEVMSTFSGFEAFRA